MTRAVFLDLVPSLSSDDFLLALRRFVGICGKPRRIYSDNGTKLVGSERELREPDEELHSAEGARKLMETQATELHFV